MRLFDTRRPVLAKVGIELINEKRSHLPCVVATWGKPDSMKTIFDILTMAIFAGLVVLFLQRSIGPQVPRDSIWQYLLAATGCAVSNYLGNNGYVIAAVGLIAGTLMYIHLVLKPFARPPQSD